MSIARVLVIAVSVSFVVSCALASVSKPGNEAPLTYDDVAFEPQPNFNLTAAQWYKFRRGIGNGPGNNALYTGVWRSSQAPTRFFSNLTWNALLTLMNNQANQGWYIDDFDAYPNGVGGLLYAVLFTQQPVGYGHWAGVSYDSFVSQWQTWSGQNLRLRRGDAYMLNGNQVFGGVYRPGTGGYALYFSSKASLMSLATNLSSSGLRLVDVSTYLSGSSVRYMGIFLPGTKTTMLEFTSVGSFLSDWKTRTNQRLIDYNFFQYTVSTLKLTLVTVIYEPSSDSHTLWTGVDLENFMSFNYLENKAGRYLKTIEVVPGSCRATCSDNVIAISPYNYLITGHNTWYRWPVIDTGSARFIRLSALNFATNPGFRLPFSDLTVKLVSGWRYSNLGYHHALDYTKGAATFAIRSVQAGKVKFVGWDNWSGNTVVVSHKNDTWRSIYMHLRDGPTHDCFKAWNKTVPWMSAGQDKTDYLSYLSNSGCSSMNAVPLTSYWGTNAEKIPVSVGASVTRGQIIAWAGNTGPGGKRGSSLSANTHLHIFFTRRDTDGNWYFIDPFGIYADTSCYPTNVTSTVSGPCVRYPVAWDEKKTQYP